MIGALAAQVAADDALARVREHANQQWWDAAVAAVGTILTTCSEFNTDAVWAVLDAIPDVATTHDPRALGAVMRQLQASKIVVATDRFQPSKRVACHGRPVRVWVAGPLVAELYQ